MNAAPKLKLAGQTPVWVGIVAGFLALSWHLTYMAEGTRIPIPHAFYIPVVVASGAFGIRAGLITALTAGVLCGPLMPLDVAAGQPQPTTGWLIRLGFFLTIAVVVGLGRNRLLELSKARQNFLSTVSHELRTPLSSVVGFASVLADQADRLTDAERYEFATLILREATELSDVVDHYVLEGRLSASAPFIDSQPNDLRRVLDIVVEGLPVHVREQRLSVSGSNVTWQTRCGYLFTHSNAQVGGQLSMEATTGIEPV